MKRLVFEAHYQVSFVTDTFVHVDIVETVLLRKGFVGGGRKQANSGDWLVPVVYNLLQYEHTYCYMPLKTTPHNGSVLVWLTSVSEV